MSYDIYHSGRELPLLFDFEQIIIAPNHKIILIVKVCYFDALNVWPTTHRGRYENCRKT